MRVGAFGDSRGKWPAAAASLLVKLSAELLKWQNPAEASGLLLQSCVSRVRAATKTFAVILLAAIFSRQSSR
jgi:hypothetical protein